MAGVTVSMRELGRYLRSLRPNNSPSLRAVASRGGLDFNFLSKLERGQYETLRLDTLRQIAKAYGVPLEKLLAVGGYVNWEEPPLPELDIYLRTKFGLNEAGIREAEGFLEYVQEKHGKAKRK